MDGLKTVLSARKTANSRLPHVRLDNVVLHRGHGLLFDRLTLDLSELRIGIIGNNGSGKSSLLRLINGLLLPDSGSVLTCGLETRDHRRQMPELAGFLFQNADHQILFPTAGEEIAFGLREAGMTGDEAEIEMKNILATNHWRDWEHRPVQELSDGQKQKLCLLAVLAMKPEILLLDEPFASLDLPTRRAMASTMLGLPQQIIMASHDFDLLAKFDRIIWLEQGRVMGDGAPGRVLSAYEQTAIEELPGEAPSEQSRCEALAR